MFFENYRNIELVVEGLKRNNIKNLVISPGGTNIPFIKLVQKDNFFNCYSVVDERSASYFAIGLYLQIRKPIALVCTSAQATRNYIPGLTEAYYKRVPILAITMEKHPRFKYQGYMQAPDQTSLPNDAIKKSFELPFLKDINDLFHSKRLVNEAILELNRGGLGPVQLCIPWLDFKIDEIESENISLNRYIISDINDIDLYGKKVLILIGEHLPFSEKEKNAINYFCENTDSVIYTNHLSNFKNDFSINGNLLLSTINDKEFEEIKPDILISIGGQTGDYPFYLRFSKTIYRKMENWIINLDGNVVDTYDKLTKIYQGNEYEFFLKVKPNKVQHEYINVWKNKINSLNHNIKVPFSNLGIAKEIHNKIPKNSIIQFSILNSLRVWSLFDLDENIECYSNVGAFGIDGGMSTLIGQSIATDKVCFLIIGDLAFFYDMNSLGIRHIKNNIRILLINNNGGVEFKLNGELNSITDNYISAANHFKNAKGWAETCGFKYLSANNDMDFVNKVDEFLSDSNEPIVFEVFISDNNEREAYGKFIKSNMKLSKGEVIREKIKNKIKNDIGIDKFNDLKGKIQGK